VVKWGVKVRGSQGVVPIEKNIHTGRKEGRKGGEQKEQRRKTVCAGLFQHK
jgi:hypothetical protein